MKWKKRDKMAANQIRIDYEQLQAVTRRFGDQAQAMRLTLQGLQKRKSMLQDGDWLGQGASAFYSEMDASVLPTFQRLAQALEAAASQTLQISAVMQAAEDQAARVLMRPAGGMGAMIQRGTPPLPTDGSGAAGAGAASSHGALGSGTLAGTSSAAAAGLAGAEQPAPVETPPDTSRTVGEALGELADTGGILGGIISILEAGGAGAFSEGVVGTTIGSILLPLGAYELGKEIGVAQQKRDAQMAQFKQKLTGAAVMDAVQTTRAQMQSGGVAMPQLNEQGRQAVQVVDAIWQQKIAQGINEQLTVDAVAYHAHIEKVWQDRYDDWVSGMARDLGRVYADSQMTR
jgi:WXG100 family type VII secretion target